MFDRILHEQRQWGEFNVLYERRFGDGISALCKELKLLPGKSISYQRHFHREEYWTIIDGEGIIVLGDKRITVKRGDKFKIECHQLHTIKAITELTIIEVQIGDILSEDDIERMPFAW